MRIFYTLFCLLFINISFSQTPVLSKVTATWCINCGTYGWSYMEELKDQLQTEEGIVLGVHFSGDLQNSTARWYAQNLGVFGQPQFFVNNEWVPVTSGNWEEKITETFELMTTPGVIPIADISFENVDITGLGDIKATINVDNLDDTANPVFLAVYVYEDKVQAYQEPLGSTIHPNVLRGVLSDEPFGVVVENGEYILEQFVEDIDDIDNVGLLAIIWEKINDVYMMRASVAQENISLVTDVDEEIILDNLSINKLDDLVVIDAPNGEEYNLSIINTQGQKFVEKQFYKTTQITTSGWPAGMYHLHIYRGNKFVTSKIVVSQ